MNDGITDFGGLDVCREPNATEVDGPGLCGYGPPGTQPAIAS
jgi:hypothetical protein